MKLPIRSLERIVGAVCEDVDKFYEEKTPPEVSPETVVTVATVDKKGIVIRKPNGDATVSTCGTRSVWQRAIPLVAPVDGSVQQLAVHTVGGVVTPAQTLMVIVPKDDPLEVEAFVENKDIGFVTAGQEAEIKIETFPYTKYGVIHGEVKDISRGAIQDEIIGFIYSTSVKRENSAIQVKEMEVNLAPGMAVTVEIKTGKRRVIEHFLTPLLQHGSESLRER